MTRAEAAVLGGNVSAARAEHQARLFANYIDASASLKEAAWLARMPYRTARRYAKKLGR